MTNEQKAKIISLRTKGLSFAEISKVLEISVNTVKSFCRRNKDNAVCKFCGTAIMQPQGTREKKFCSDKCRMAWWNSHTEEVNRKAVYTFECECCGKEFQAYGNSHRKYCSRSCYTKSRFGGAAAMTDIEFRNEKLYQTTMSLAKRLRLDGVITESEYCQIDTIFTNKYKPVFGTLFSSISLTSEP